MKTPASRTARSVSPLSSASVVSLLTLLVIGLGLLLRLVQYLANRSLWLDEAFLSLNLLTLSYHDFLHQPLQFMQTAPPVFLWLEKLIVQMFGSSEFALRVLPLTAGLVSVPLYYGLARQLLEPAAAVLAVSLFALSSNLIYYSSEVKPYGCDVAVAIGLTLLLMDTPTASCTLRRMVAYSVAGALALWCSYASGVVLIALMVWSVAACWRRGALTRLARFVPVWLIWTASFFVLYHVCLRGVARDQRLREFYQQFWSTRFPLRASTMWGALVGWGRVIVESFRDPGALHAPAVAAGLFLVGAVGMAKKDASQALLALLPTMVTLVLTAMKILPFGNRLILFLVPFLLIPIAAGVGWLSFLPAWWFRLLGVTAGIAVVGPTLVVAAHLLTHPIQIEELKPVLAQVHQHRDPADAVYVYHWSQYPFRYYAPRYGLDPHACMIGKPLTDAAAWQQLAGLRQYRRAWIIVSHGYRWIAEDDERRLLRALDQMGQRVSVTRSTGAAAYLYQF